MLFFVDAMPLKYVNVVSSSLSVFCLEGALPILSLN
jgi:hypothetical protein